MSKGKKTTLWKRITHLRIDVPINIDRDTATFWAEIAGQKIEAETGAEAERLIKEAIETSLTTTWQPVIVLSLSDYGDTYQNQKGSISVGFDRKYVGEVPELGLADTQWHAKDDLQRLQWANKLVWNVRDHGEFKPPCSRGWSSSAHSRTYYLPYNDALWSACDALVRAIKGLDFTIRSNLDEHGGAGLSDEIMPLLRFLPVE